MSHNPIRPWRNIERRKSRQIRVANVLVGGDAPIAVQSMTNTPTEDAGATIEQIIRCAEAGADIVRVSCPTEESTKAMHQIVKASPVPLVADIHFHYKRGIEAADAGAACLRINPFYEPAYKVYGQLLIDQGEIELGEKMLQYSISGPGKYGIR